MSGASSVDAKRALAQAGPVGEALGHGGDRWSGVAGGTSEAMGGTEGEGSGGVPGVVAAAVAAIPVPGEC